LRSSRQAGAASRRCQPGLNQLVHWNGTDSVIPMQGSPVLARAAQNNASARGGSERKNRRSVCRGPRAHMCRYGAAYSTRRATFCARVRCVSPGRDRQLWHHPTQGKGSGRRRTGRASLHVRRRRVPDDDAPGALDRRHTVKCLGSSGCERPGGGPGRRREASSSGASTPLSQRFSHRPIWPRLSRAAGCTPPIRTTPGRQDGKRRLPKARTGASAFRVHARKGGRGVRGRVGPLLPHPHHTPHPKMTHHHRSAVQRGSC
jgi:hypothetical protein